MTKNNKPHDPHAVYNITSLSYITYWLKVYVFPSFAGHIQIALPSRSDIGITVRNSTLDFSLIYFDNKNIGVYRFESTLFSIIRFLPRLAFSLILLPTNDSKSFFISDMALGELTLPPSFFYPVNFITKT